MTAGKPLKVAFTIRSPAKVVNLMSHTNITGGLVVFFMA